MEEYNLLIECVDESDALHLKKRLSNILSQIDMGDYSGREIKTIKVEE